MGERPTTALWGIGAKTARRLADLGIETVAQLGAADARQLADEIGPTIGPWLRRLGRGVDSSPVDATPWVPRAHGRETTFQVDLTDWDEVAGEARRLAATVAEDLRREGRPAARVGVKVRYVPFETRQRSLTLAGADRRGRRHRGGGRVAAGALRPGPRRAAARRPGRDGAGRERTASVPVVARARCAWPA